MKEKTIKAEVPTPEEIAEHPLPSLKNKTT